MKKILLALILMFTFSAGMVTAKTTAINGLFDGFQIVKLFSNGKEIKPDKIPGINYKGNTLIPIGSLRALGVDVLWDAATYSVNVKLPQRTVPVLTAGQLDELSKYVYKIQGSTDDPNLVHQGSGFILGSTLITAAHVAADSATIQVKIDGQWQTVGSQQFINTKVDIKGFAVTGGKSLPTSTELPLPGDPCYDISIPHGVLKVTEGVVNAIMPINGIPHIKHSADTDPGGSGGFLVNGRGEIIGVNVSGMDVNGESINYAIPISNALDELNK